MPTYIPFDPDSPDHHSLLVSLWNSALPPGLALSPEFVHSVTRPITGGLRQGRIATVDGQAAGVILASIQPDAPPSLPRDLGWIDAVAVTPAFQRCGLGRALLTWAEAWLVGLGARQITTGCARRHITPGAPPDAIPFFRACGYQLCPWTHWDLARNLADYTPPPSLREVPAAAYAAQPGQEDELLAFLHREFPGGWAFEAEEFLREGGRISDFVFLWTADGVEGVCKLSFEDSLWGMGRYYPYDLPRPWGQLGFIGVAEARRGQGMGLFLLDAGLRRLRDNGVNGCVIDWTDLLDFYGKAGFARYHRWVVLQKETG